MPFKNFFSVLLLTLFVNYIPSIAVDKKLPRVLFFEPWNFIQPGGLGISNFHQAKLFAQKNHPLLLLFWQGSYSENLFIQAQLPYATLSRELYKQSALSYNEFITKLERGSFIPLPDAVYIQELTKICKKAAIDIIVTPAWTNLAVLKSVAKKLRIKIVLVRHASPSQELSWHLDRNLSLLKGIHGFIGGNEEITNYIKQVNQVQKLNIKNISTITPFWDEKKCLNFSTNQTREDYFKRKFYINIHKLPVVCTVANLVDPCKNHPLLFQALALLIQKQQFAHLMIAGGGPLRVELEQLAKDLKIDNYVHFLGMVENIPELFFHCDMHVLPSYYESFSLANLEAACMKKPIIIAQEVPAAKLIQNFESGLLFHSQDAVDLASKIQYLINNPQERLRLGSNAFHHVNNNYSNESMYKKWRTFLKKLMQGK